MAHLQICLRQLSHCTNIFKCANCTQQWPLPLATKAKARNLLILFHFRAATYGDLGARKPAQWTWFCAQLQSATALFTPMGSLPSLACVKASMSMWSNDTT
eukprot:864501-Amphidinium_carterae.2